MMLTICRETRMARCGRRTIAFIFTALFLLHFLASFVHAFGPIFSDIEREDGLCASLVRPVPGYVCSEYMVQTDDDFMLGLQRINSVRYSNRSNEPVLLLHGILLGGDIWVLNPQGESLAYLLADRGFDVWLANTRTTRFSHGHVTYSRKDKGFWDWSLDELAQYDLPAMVGTVTTVTNRATHYIGFSQGTQQLFAALSEGRLQDQLDKVVLVAPVAYVNHVSPPVLQIATSFYIDKLYQALHVYEFSTSFRSREWVDIVCRQTASKCYVNFLDAISGKNCCLNTTRRAIIDAYETQSTAMKNLLHLSQLVRRGTFAKYDYGFMGNMMRYFWGTPPVYDLRKVPTNSKTFLIYAGLDGLSDPVDVKSILAMLPNSGTYAVKYIPQYAHLDFVLGYNAKETVYDDIADFLSN